MHFPCQHSALYKATWHCNCLTGEIEDAIYSCWYVGMVHGSALSVGYGCEYDYVMAHELGHVVSYYLYHTLLNICGHDCTDEIK